MDYDRKEETIVHMLHSLFEPYLKLKIVLCWISLLFYPCHVLAHETQEYTMNEIGMCKVAFPSVLPSGWLEILSILVQHISRNMLNLL